MILTGAQIIARRLVQNLREVSLQQQPRGIDLTLRQISTWNSSATIDFDNSQRQSAKTTLLTFNKASNSISLSRGTYLVDFNETVVISRNCLATVYPRSSLWRSGVGIHAGVVDAGYQGAIGAMMEVRNERGITLHRDAKLTQIVFAEMGEEVEGYDGIYQGSTQSSMD
jgi:dUTP pyrophosphatase